MSDETSGTKELADFQPRTETLYPKEYTKPPKARSRFRKKKSQLSPPMIKDRFEETFVTIDRGLMDAHYAENVWERENQIITSMDFAKRQTRLH